MPRPITKKDIIAWNKSWANGTLRGRAVKRHDKIGIYIKTPSDPQYCYSVDKRDRPIWVVKSTIQKRKSKGWPKKRVKVLMREPDFGLDEMALAERIIAGE